MFGAPENTPVAGALLRRRSPYTPTTHLNIGTSGVTPLSMSRALLPTTLTYIVRTQAVVENSGAMLLTPSTPLGNTLKLSPLLRTLSLGLLISCLSALLSAQVPWTEGDYPPCVDCTPDPVVTFLLALVVLCLAAFLGYLAGADSKDR